MEVESSIRDIVRGNPTMPVQIRRQLATDPENVYVGLAMDVDKWTISLNGPLKKSLHCSDGRFVDPDHPEKSILLRKALYGLKQAQEPGYPLSMGTWYPKDSGFELTAFSDADHARCLDTRKSTSGGIQFLGAKLVSWMLKKQNCTAMSSAEAEYVALSASCAQVNVDEGSQLQDYGFKYNK
ncbi:hypothetical protein Tco_1153776 [Tanacetum coccineum]